MEKNTNGTKALLIEGARRIGKSTVVEEFGRNEYKSYIMHESYIIHPKNVSIVDEIIKIPPYMFFCCC